MAFESGKSDVLLGRLVHGDSHNNSFPGGCNDEPAAVGLIRPRITWGAVQLRGDGGAPMATAVAAPRWQAEELWP